MLAQRRSTAPCRPSLLQAAAAGACNGGASLLALLGGKKQDLLVPMLAMY